MMYPYHILKPKSSVLTHDGSS